MAKNTINLLAIYLYEPSQIHTKSRPNKTNYALPE